MFVQLNLIISLSILVLYLYFFPRAQNRRNLYNPSFKKIDKILMLYYKNYFSKFSSLGDFPGLDSVYKDMAYSLEKKGIKRELLLEYSKKGKIKNSNWVFSIISLLISFMGGSGVEGKIYEYNLVNIIPYISIIVLALTGLNVINVLGIGIALGLGIGLFHGSFTFVEIFGILQRGLGWMEDMSIIAIVVGGVVALMNHFGGITYLLENLTARIKSKRGAETGIAVLVSLLDLATTNNTVSIITAGPMAKDIADKFGVDRKRVAGLLDLFSSAFQGLMPYAGQMLMAAGMAQISPASIVPYSWYSMLMIVMGALSIATGLPNFKNSKA